MLEKVEQGVAKACLPVRADDHDGSLWLRRWDCLSNVECNRVGRFVVQQRRNGLCVKRRRDYSKTITVSVATAPAQAGVSGAGVAEQSPAVFNGLSFGGTVPADISLQFATATNPGVVGLGSAGAAVQISGLIDTDGLVSVSPLPQNDSWSCQGKGVARVKTRCVRSFSDSQILRFSDSQILRI